jgi:hypothetical protein
MSQWYPLWFPPSLAMLKSGAAAVDKGLAASPPTERERAYLEAIAHRFRPKSWPSDLVAPPARLRDVGAGHRAEGLGR